MNYVITRVQNLKKSNSYIEARIAGIQMLKNTQTQR